MRTYLFEVTKDDQHFRVVKVTAKTLNEAFEKFRSFQSPPALEKDEHIYQVSRDFDDCELVQPVWDFFNTTFGMEEEHLYDNYTDLVFKRREAQKNSL